MAKESRDRIIRLGKEIKLMTGNDPYLYTSQPGDGQTRVVFQGFNNVRLGWAAGLNHITELWSDAYRAYTDKEGPFDKEATEQVSQWICNDGEFYDAAYALAESGDLGRLRDFLTATLNRARMESAAWYVRRGLSDRDLDMVEWFEVAKDLAIE